MIYCVSDIHGELDKVERMLKLIRFSDSDHLHIIGDVIDCGIMAVDSKSPCGDTFCIVGHMPANFLTGRNDENFHIWHSDGIIDIDCGCGNRKAEQRRLACLRGELYGSINASQ